MAERRNWRKLAEALAWYARHQTSCRIYARQVGTDTDLYGVCDCGLDDLSRQLEEARRPTDDAEDADAS